VPLMGGYQKTTLALLLLLVLVAASALAVVYNSFLNRQSFIAFTSLEQDYNELRTDFGRLQLEYSTWASPALVEQTALEKLRMQTPGAGQIVLVPVTRLSEAHTGSKVDGDQFAVTRSFSTNTAPDLSRTESIK